MSAPAEKVPTRTHDREDTGLFDRLSRELPGILLWALAGWQRLRCRGPVMQPRSGRELLAAMDMEELKSPISAFLGDRCVLDPREIVPVATLYGLEELVPGARARCGGG